MKQTRHYHDDVRKLVGGGGGGTGGEGELTSQWYHRGLSPPLLLGTQPLEQLELDDTFETAASATRLAFCGLVRCHLVVFGGPGTTWTHSRRLERDQSLQTVAFQRPDLPSVDHAMARQPV